MKPQRRHDPLMDGVRRAYYISASLSLEKLIEATPSGKERNILTQANMFLMAAQSEFNGEPQSQFNDEGVPGWPKE